MPILTTTYADGEVLSGARLNNDFIYHENLEYGFKDHFFGSVNYNTDYTTNSPGLLFQTGHQAYFSGVSAAPAIMLSNANWNQDRVGRKQVFECRFQSLAATNLYTIGVASGPPIGIMNQGAYFTRKAGTDLKAGSFFYMTVNTGQTGSTITYDNASDPGTTAKLFKIEIDNGSATFYIDNANKASIATNMPAATTVLRPFFMMLENQNIVGSMVVDFLSNGISSV